MKRKKRRPLSAMQLSNLKECIRYYEEQAFVEDWARAFYREWKKIKGPYSDSRPFEAYNLMSFWFAKFQDFLKEKP